MSSTILATKESKKEFLLSVDNCSIKREWKIERPGVWIVYLHFANTQNTNHMTLHCRSVGVYLRIEGISQMYLYFLLNRDDALPAYFPSVGGKITDKQTNIQPREP